jgi:signal transduction histidine kinase/AmiR/NasT family two-component response regulator/HPt (histidine-containing phosphotransfer) domain-containing protein
MKKKGAPHNGRDQAGNPRFRVSAALLLAGAAALAAIFLNSRARNDAVLYWIIAVYTAVFFLMSFLASPEKSSPSARARDVINTFMAATPNLMVMVDEMNRIMYLSKPLAELARIENHEMAAGRPVMDLFHDIDVKMVIGEILETGGFYDGALEMVRNGRKRYFKISSGKFPGDTPGRFIDMSDITPIMESRLEAEESKARAEEANSAKSSFLARMSHEIRTPMNAITGMSELILREEASPPVHEYAAAVKQAGINLVAIINDILDFSKIESGKMEIIGAGYEFSSLINDVITIIRMRLREKPVYFAVNLDSAIPQKLYGDVVRIRQILLNLLSNAAKYTQKGHVLFTVDPAERGDKSLTLRFKISDTGVGIRREDLGRLFDNFSRLDFRANRDVEGTGLGLAISRSLCQAMGGDITVESEYGEGSTFTAYIPQEIRDNRPFAGVADPAGKKVLVYETREVYGASIVYSVENLGIPCRLVAEAGDFAEALESDRFDFVFTPSFLFGEAWREIKKRGIGAALVLLAEYGEAVTEQQSCFIAMPAHTMSIANILNGVEDLQGYSEDNPGFRFTAPDARVLIVDDIKTNLDVAEGLLSPYAMQVDSCLSGREALRLAGKNTYDLVLMDHMMPGMDGIETVREIRSLPGEYFQKLPIVVLTANAIAGMRDMFLNSGFNDYISKPIDITKLDEVIAQWIPAGKRIRNTAGLKRNIFNGKSSIVIPGVDTGKGISLTGGTDAGYRKVLAQFRKDALDRIVWFGAFLSGNGQAGGGDSGGNLSEFIVHVHALKSASGTIGATELPAEAAALETMGKTGNKAAVDAALPGFRQRLTALVEDIGQALKPESAPSPVPPSSLRAPLLSLKQALEAKNMREIDRLLAELEGAAGAGTRAQIEDLSDKVLMGEYQGAADVIDRLSAGELSLGASFLGADGVWTGL